MYCTLLHIRPFTAIFRGKNKLYLEVLNL